MASPKFPTLQFKLLIIAQDCYLNAPTLHSAELGTGKAAIIMQSADQDCVHGMRMPLHGNTNAMPGCHQVAHGCQQLLAGRHCFRLYKACAQVCKMSKLVKLVNLQLVHALANNKEMHCHAQVSSSAASSWSCGMMPTLKTALNS